MWETERRGDAGASDFRGGTDPGADKVQGMTVHEVEKRAEAGEMGVQRPSVGAGTLSH